MSRSSKFFAQPSTTKPRRVTRLPRASVISTWQLVDYPMICNKNSGGDLRNDSAADGRDESEAPVATARIVRSLRLAREPRGTPTDAKQSGCGFKPTTSKTCQSDRDLPYNWTSLIRYPPSPA